MAKTGYRRKNYFIKRKFQADFFLKFALLLFLEAVIIAALFMLISRGTLTTAYYGTELTIQKTGIFFLRNFILITCVAGLGVGLSGVFVFMFLTHRLGGPLYKFEKTLKDARGGNISTRMRLRKTDQMQDLKDQLNAFIEDLDTRLSVVKADIDKELRLISNDGSSGTVELKDLLIKTKNSLEHFKTSK